MFERTRWPRPGVASPNARTKPVQPQHGINDSAN